MSTVNSLKSRGYVQRHEFFVEFVRGKRILDVGIVGATCADDRLRVAAFEGSLHRKLAGAAREAVGIDYAEGAIARLTDLYPELTLVAADVYAARRALQGIAPFEVVVLGDIVEHLDNPGAALDEVRELLDPGGYLIVSTPNALGLPNFLRHLTGRFHEGEDHVLSFNKFTLAKLLHRHGFTVVSVYTCLDREPDNRSAKRRYAFGAKVLRRLPELGGTLLLTAVSNA
jgi:2-polyprenyl-3-methyl-5-hydroxy-6-metoxy-1,4-benzoquinol methylase